MKSYPRALIYGPGRRKLNPSQKPSGRKDTVNGKKMNLNNFVKAAIFTAMAIALGFVFMLIPNVEFISVTVFLSGLTLGLGFGAMVGGLMIGIMVQVSVGLPFMEGHTEAKNAVALAVMILILLNMPIY